MDHLGSIYALLCLHCVKVALPSANQNQFISANLVMSFLTHWFLDTRNTKCPGATVACSSMGYLLCSLARVYPFQGPETNPAELRVVGTERKKSPSGSLGVMVSEDLLSPFGCWTHLFFPLRDLLEPYRESHVEVSHLVHTLYPEVHLCQILSAGWFFSCAFIKPFYYFMRLAVPG